MADPESVDVTPKKDGGVLKQVLKEGEGSQCAPTGCRVKVHYTGTLTDGTKFDSSRDRNEPFEFDLGKGSVIKAWDMGVATMKQGERAILTCAPEYAYGEAGSPPTIPPDSTLKFDVEVIDWRGQDLSPNSDEGIERLQMTPGEGYTTPNDGAVVQVHIIGKHEGRVFDERDVTFTIGEGCEEKIIDGVEKAIQKFKKNETSVLKIKPKYAFGAAGSAEYNIPPDATVEYTVTLKEFEKAKESWQLDSNEKVDQCKLVKEKGTNYFKAGKYNLAKKMYKKIIELMDSEKDTQSIAEESKALVLSAHLNLSLCYLKQQDYSEARSQATSALSIDPQSEKAYFRRGQAFLGLSEPKLALADFQQCLKIEPQNKAALAQQSVCMRAMKEILQKEKKIYANMFDKFAKTDTQREEIEKKKEPNVMSSVGEWGKEDREREPSEFEKENPNILMLNSSGEFKDM